MRHYNLVHKFNPMPQVAKILDAKAAGDKEWNKLETMSARQLNKVKSKKGGYPRGPKKTNRKVHFATVMDRSWNQHFRSTKVESCSEGTL